MRVCVRCVLFWVLVCRAEWAVFCDSLCLCALMFTALPGVGLHRNAVQSVNVWIVLYCFLSGLFVLVYRWPEKPVTL
jgi:hypothetical protein